VKRVYRKELSCTYHLLLVCVQFFAKGWSLHTACLGFRPLRKEFITESAMKIGPVKRSASINHGARRFHLFEDVLNRGILGALKPVF